MVANMYEVCVLLVVPSVDDPRVTWNSECGCCLDGETMFVPKRPHHKTPEVCGNCGNYLIAAE